jgi:predicted small metal-binding protein
MLGPLVVSSLPEPAYPFAAMKETERKLVVRCECGYEAKGDEDEVVALINKHASELHNMRATREEILSRAESA